MATNLNEPMAITDCEFEVLYQPVQNHLRSDSAFNGWMFETFGKELEFIEQTRRVSPECLWTIVEDDDGLLVIVSGYHVVNRFGYVVTTKPCQPIGCIMVTDD